MINKSNIEDKTEITAYIGDMYYKSLYLYLNLDKYGFDSNEVKVYTQIIDGTITAVLLSFGKTLHIFSRDNNLNTSEIRNFIVNNCYSIICSDGTIANSLYDEYNKKDFSISIGSVLELKKISSSLKTSNNLTIERAKENEFEKLVDFLISDEDKKKVYTKEGLFNQISSRNKEGYGRNYIAKENDSIIAHAGTGAENNNIAIVNSVLVEKNHRGKGYATTIVKKLCEDLILENKTCYLMVLEDKKKKLYQKIGFEKKCSYGKLIRNVK